MSDDYDVRILIDHRINKAKETFEDAKILAENQRWNSAINRLYYAAFYAVTALLLKENFKTTTHNGVKINFSESFIKTRIFPQEFGRIYSQLFTWRQKGDYTDLFDFTEEKVIPYFEHVEKLIKIVEDFVQN
jgi:uncharacterized protein (UPF0332 family)